MSNLLLGARVKYPTQVVTTIGQQVRIGLPALNERSLAEYDLTLAAPNAPGEDEITVTATPYKIWAGEQVTYDVAGTDVRVVIADTYDAGSTTLDIIAREAGEPTIPASAVAKYCPTIFVAGATNASPASQPKTTDTTNFNSGVGQEMAVIGTNRTLTFAFNLIVGDPGGQALMLMLFDDRYYSREIMAFVRRTDQSEYTGAAILTTGSQESPTQEKATMSVNMQFQGASFNYKPGPNAVIPEFA